MIKTNTNKLKNFFENSYRNIVINEVRKKLLLKIAHKISDSYVFYNHQININFICTHNSRRSQLGQVWTFFASHYFDLNINALSGGTEVTEFHKNTCKTLKDAGFIFTIKEFSHLNPMYEISFNGAKKSLIGFSKMYDHSINKTPYLVLTTCNNADENCPLIPEAIHRFHLPYKDPKHSDDSPNQEATYLQTNKEVAAEMYFLYNEVKNIL
ncbi:MAG: Protein ArsC [Flavobacterium sp. SCGC AAA160-P02]|nr:MAG: Protein ArsC [Flavobacterium sp. SCGC AAA160-P02]